jgi:hypothetical protein
VSFGAILDFGFWIFDSGMRAFRARPILDATLIEMTSQDETVV